MSVARARAIYDAAMDKLRVRPMTEDEFATLRSRLVREYAAEHVRAGNWTPDEAEARAAAQTDELLPQGLGTPRVLWLVAETTAGKPIGHVWIGPKPHGGDATGAWIYSIEIDPDERAKGFGRLLLAAAETEAERLGYSSIGLNVFGPNTIARNLYESSGYEIASLQMRKPLTASR
jgi:GNAT superfamily N-acetyltransferase